MSDTWRDKMVAALLDDGVSNEFGMADRVADAVLPVLVAAQQEAAAEAWDDGYAAARLDADEEPYSDRPERATWHPRQNPHRASALRAGGETT